MQKAGTVDEVVDVPVTDDQALAADIVGHSQFGSVSHLLQLDNDSSLLRQAVYDSHSHTNGQNCEGAEFAAIQPDSR